MVKHPEDVHRLRGATRFLTELFLNSEVSINCVNSNIMVKHPEDVHRLRGATRFLRELFLNSEVSINGVYPPQKNGSALAYKSALKLMPNEVPTSPVFGFSHNDLLPHKKEKKKKKKIKKFGYV